MIGSTAAPLIWDLAGKPRPEGAKGDILTDTPGVCAICGDHATLTAAADKALGGNFADQAIIRRRDTDRVCGACYWCASGRPPNTLRMWTVIAAPGHPLPPSQDKAFIKVDGLCLTSRANTRPIIDVLANPPAGDWAVAVAYSGQKHVAPYTQLNHGAGQWTIRVEDHNVTATPEQWAAVHDAALTLRRLGVPADAVVDGAPANIRTRPELITWQHCMDVLGPWVRSPLLVLAVWTMTKPITHPEKETP